MATQDSTPLERALALLNEALKTGIRGHNREAVKSAIEVLEDNGRSGLTELHYKNLPVGKTLRDPQRPGLWMRRNKTCAIWIYNPTKGKPVTIGEYPAMSVIEARQEWKAMKDAEKQGEGPTAKPMLLKDLCERFINEYAKQHKRSWREDRRMFDYDLIPELGERDVLSITRDDIEELLEDIIDRGSPRSAEKLLTVTRKMFNHVIEQPRKKRWVQGLEHNPCHHIKLKKRESITPHMTDAQVRKFLRGLPDVDIPQVYKDIMLLQFQTVARVGEVAGLTWDEVDFKHGVWDLPAERSKNKRPHRVMLSKQSLALLESVKEGGDSNYVFPAKRSSGHIPGTLVARYLRDNRKTLGVPDGMGTHGFRHTAMTQLASLGCSKELRDRISNHKDGSVDSIYQHYEHDAEAKEWWQKWADRMDVLVADNVTTLRGEQA